jgi:hypothetical protein
MYETPIRQVLESLAVDNSDDSPSSRGDYGSRSSNGASKGGRQGAYEADISSQSLSFGGFVALLASVSFKAFGDIPPAHRIAKLFAMLLQGGGSTFIGK